MIRVLFIILLLGGCSQQITKSHIGTTAGAISGFTACRTLLNSGMELTAACTLIGAWAGANAFHKDDIHTHSAVFVDTLNSAPGERSHTYWSNSQTENWGSITVIINSNVNINPVYGFLINILLPLYFHYFVFPLIFHLHP